MELYLVTLPGDSVGQGRIAHDARRWRCVVSELGEGRDCEGLWEEAVLSDLKDSGQSSSTQT